MLDSVNGTITMSSKTDIKEIKSISYGIKVKTHICSHVSNDGKMIPKWEPAKNETWKIPGYHADKINNEFSIIEHDLIDNLIESNQISLQKLKQDDNMNWLFPANETIAYEFKVNFPIQYEDFFLPSTNRNFEEDYQGPVHHAITVQYFIYVRVLRIGSFMKKVKADEFMKEVIYIGGCEHLPPPGMYRHICQREFTKKITPNLIDNETGKFEGKRLNTKLFNIKMPSILGGYGNKQLKALSMPTTMSFDCNSLINIHKSLFKQIGITMAFDLTNFNFPYDFMDDSHSNGLGLFQITGCKISAVYETWSVGGKSPQSTGPLLITNVATNGLIFDILDCQYEKETKLGQIHLSSEELIERAGSYTLMDYMPWLVFTSCNMGYMMKNITTLQFTWNLSDVNNRVSFPFMTKSTIAAEIVPENSPEKIDQKVS